MFESLDVYVHADMRGVTRRIYEYARIVYYCGKHLMRVERGYRYNGIRCPALVMTLNTMLGRPVPTHIHTHVARTHQSPVHAQG